MIDTACNLTLKFMALHSLKEKRSLQKMNKQLIFIESNHLLHRDTPVGPKG